VKDNSLEPNSSHFKQNISDVLSSMNQFNTDSSVAVACVTLLTKGSDREALYGVIMPGGNGHHLRLVYGGVDAWKAAVVASSRSKKRARESATTTTTATATTTTTTTATSTATKSDSNQYDVLQKLTEANTFYNELDRQTATSKTESKLFHMRNLNNWVKTCLINEAVTSESVSLRQLKVFDFACGKGGDVGKFVRRAQELNLSLTRYVGMDVAEESLKEAGDRITTTLIRCRMDKVTNWAFLHGDFGSSMKMHRKSSLKVFGLKDLVDGEVNVVCESKNGGGGSSGLVNQNETFNVVSCQFALHYAMGTKERALAAFRTASEKLSVGGKLIITTVDARVALNYLMNKLGKRKVENDRSPCSIVLGNGGCKLTFAQEVIDKILIDDDKLKKGEVKRVAIHWLHSLLN